jgi:hypothetical protein
MQALWFFLSDPQVQATLSWLGGGLAALAAGCWAVLKYLRKSGTGESGDTRTARTGQGIAAAGDVHFSGTLNIRKGTPPWLLAFLFLAILLLVLRGTAPFTYANQGEIETALSGASLKGRDGETLVFLILDTDGTVRSHSVENRQTVTGSGRWDIADDQLCIEWDRSRGAIDAGCYRVAMAADDVRLVHRDASFRFAGAADPQPPIVVDLDPRETYLRTQQDPGARPAKIIRLADLGIAAGDVIELAGTGTFDTGHPDLPDLPGLLGVFSSTDRLLPGAARYRVPGAIAAGPSPETFPTYHGWQPTDIPQDFAITDIADGFKISNFTGRRSVAVAVPDGAQYLFVGTWDNLFHDNREVQPWKLEIRKLSS